MTDHPVLQDARILVLEDDFYLATDLQQALEAAGATVIGPFADAVAAGGAIASSQPDCALVDLNLGNGMCFDLPRHLTALDVPFAFVTGYDRAAILPEFAHVARVEKPVDARAVVALADRLLRQR